MISKSREIIRISERRYNGRGCSDDKGETGVVDDEDARVR